MPSGEQKMSLSGNPSSSNSSESYCSSPPLQPQAINAQNQPQHNYYSQYPPVQYQTQHQGYYQQSSPHSFYQNHQQQQHQQQPLWTNNSAQGQQSTNPQQQHYYHQQYPYTAPAHVQYPQQGQPQPHQHALVDLSRFVQQSPAQGPITHSTQLPINTNPSKEISSTPGTSSAAAPSSSPMIPVRFQNMTKGARTKAGMRKLKQEQGGATTEANTSKPPKKSPKKKLPEIIAARGERTSVDEAIDAALLESSQGEEDEDEILVRVGKGRKEKSDSKKVSKPRVRASTEKKPRQSKKTKSAGSSVVEMDIANSLLELKASHDLQDTTDGGSGRGSTEEKKGARSSKSPRKSPAKNNSPNANPGSVGGAFKKSNKSPKDKDTADVKKMPPFVECVEVTPTKVAVPTPAVTTASPPRKRGRPRSSARLSAVGSTPTTATTTNAKESKSATKQRQRKPRPKKERPQAQEQEVELGEVFLSDLSHLSTSVAKTLTPRLTPKIKKPRVRKPRVRPLRPQAAVHVQMQEFSPVELPTIPKAIPVPSVWAKKPQPPTRTQDGKEKEKETLVGPSIKVIRGAVQVFHGSDEEDLDEPLTKFLPRERFVGHFDPDVPWECRFCGIGPLEMKLGDLFGPYFMHSQKDGIPCKQETWVHQDCALWAGGVILVGPKLVGLDNAVHYADKLTCGICKRKGATIGCLSQGCTNMVHFPCGKMADWSLDYETFHSYCDHHKGVPSMYSGRW